jgi:hypothetical protein
MQEAVASDIRLLNDGDIALPRCGLKSGIVPFNLICVGQRKFTHGFVKFIT